ncbi:glycosyltransferase family 4 protein, partial [Schumannella luteola]
ERYLLTVAGPEPRKDLATTLAAVSLSSSGLPLVVATADAEGVRALAAEAGTTPELLHVVDTPPDADLGVLYHGAHAYLCSSVAEGFGLAVLEALAFGLPVVHTSLPALDELTAGAAISVERDDPHTLPARLAEAIDAIDGELADRLSTAAGDRSRAFSWRDSADKIWQLHADL